MSEDLTRTEEQLRTLLATRAADVPPVDLHDRTVRRAVRRRRTVIAAGAVAVALVAAGVPTALAVVRSDAASVPADKPAPKPYSCPRGQDPIFDPAIPVQRDVAGSLGGNPAAVRAVAAAGWGASRTSGSNGQFQPSLVRVVFVERGSDGGIVGVVTTASRNGSALARAVVVGSDAAHLHGLSDGWIENSPGKRLTERFGESDGYAVAVSECGPARLIMVGPAGSAGELAWTAGIAADATIDQRRQQVPLEGGFAVVDRPDTPAVVGFRVVRDGGTIARGTSGDERTPKEPSYLHLRSLAKAAPGNASPDRLPLSQGMNALPVPQKDITVLWTGQGDGVSAAAAVSTLPSGALYLWGGGMRGGQTEVRFGGVLAQGALDRAAYRLLIWPGKPYAVFFDGIHRVDITTGGRTRTESHEGGLLVAPGDTVVVRGADGTPLPLLDPTTDVPQVPSPMRW